MKQRWLHISTFLARASRHNNIEHPWEWGVALSHQRRGYAASLMKVAVGFARAQGIVWLDLHVFSDNERAMVLYRRFGFVETGRTVDFYRLRGGSVDDVAMSLRL